MVKSLQEILGIVNFYNRLICSAAHLLKPLYEAVHWRKAADAVVCTQDRIAAFDGVKFALASASLLAHPDSGAPIALKAFGIFQL